MRTTPYAAALAHGFASAFTILDCSSRRRNACGGYRGADTRAGLCLR